MTRAPRPVNDDQEGEHYVESEGAVDDEDSVAASPEKLFSQVVGDDDLLDDPEDEDTLVEDPLADALVPTGDRPAPLAPIRDPLQRFLAETRRYPRLTEDEERALIQNARGDGDGDAAKKLVLHNLRLVVTIAYQYRRAWTSMLDLFQEGSIGLLEAVRRWEPDLGTRFGTYAAYWIRAYILRFLMRNARLIHVGNTRAGRKLFFRLNKERAKLRAAGFDPTPRLLAANLNMSEQDVREVSQHLDAREISLSPKPDTEGIDLIDKIPASTGSTPEDQVAHNLLADSVRGVMDTFAASLADERETAIWNEHLAAGEPQSLNELGKRFGVSKQRMGQIAERLKKRFRAKLIADLGSDIEMSWSSEG